MTNREVMHQALEALENIDKAMPFPVGKQAITALKAALEQPEQEPVAIDWQQGSVPLGGNGCSIVSRETIPFEFRQPAAQPEQEPTPWRDMIVVSLVREGIDKHKARELADHFAAQPEQEPVKPTEQEVHNAAANLALMREMFGDPNKPAAKVNNEGFIVETGLLLSPGTLLYTTPPAARPEQSLDDLVAEFESTPAGTESMRQGREWLKDLLEQEPVAWGVFEGNLHDMFFTQEEAQEMAQLKGSHAEVRPLYTTAAQPKQEPVAFYHPHKGFYWAKPTHISAPTVVDVPPVPLYVKWKAAQRPWVGLTKVQRDDFADAYGSYQAVCDIEQALKERNNG